MKVLIVEPLKKPYVKNIEPGLHSLQREVNGCIDVTYPFEDLVGLICNDEGKINCLPLNRALYDDKGHLYDIVAGTFIIAGLSEDDFTDLSDELIEKFSKRFEFAEQFISINGHIVAIPCPYEK